MLGHLRSTAIASALTLAACGGGGDEHSDDGHHEAGPVAHLVHHSPNGDWHYAGADEATHWGLEHFDLDMCGDGHSAEDDGHHDAHDGGHGDSHDEEHVEGHGAGHDDDHHAENDHPGMEEDDHAPDHHDSHATSGHAGDDHQTGGHEASGHASAHHGDNTPHAPLMAAMSGPITGAPIDFFASFSPLRTVIVKEGAILKAGLIDRTSLPTDDGDYRLTHYHLHAPSVHTRNGEHFPLEVHFGYADEQDQLLALSVVFEAGAPHDGLAAFLNALGSPRPVRLNPGHLVPEDLSVFEHTTSPADSHCSANVQWRVADTPLTVGDWQMIVLTDLMKEVAADDGHGEDDQGSDDHH